MEQPLNNKEFIEYMNIVSEHKILVSRILAEWQRQKVAYLNIIPKKLLKPADDNAITIDNIDRALFLSVKISHTAKNPDFLEWLRKIDNKLLEIKCELKKLAN